MNSYSQLSSLNRRFTFSCENLDKNTFEVVRFEGEEALSTLYRFEIVLASADGNIETSRVVNRHARFTLNDGVENGSDTVYRGLVKEFTAEHQQGNWTLYKAILVPVLAQLEAFHLSEVYLDKDKDKVLRRIFENAGIGSDYCDLRMKNAGAEIPKTAYICQYQETYFNFIARWCERLGAYWWFEDVDGKERAVFSDTWAAHKPEVLTLHYQPAGVLDADIGQMRRVQRLVEKSQGLPKQVTLMDYNPQRAGNPDISAGAIVDENGIGEIYLYGENLKSNEDAARIARLRAEGMRCLGTQYHGSTTATGLRCGHYAEIKGHFRAACNRRLLLTAVRHRGAQSGILLDELGADRTEKDDFYIAEFSGIPSDVQFRPLRQYLWPKIEGSMHAFIDAEGSGQYAELNEKGEYKVQVPFDITQKGANRGSAWVRMATPYAGSGHGMHFPLHKGTEVLLSFINGDPDQPVIIGAVPNSMTTSPVVNANQSTSRIVTGGGQEVSFGDQDGDKYTLMKSSENCWIRLGQKNPFSTNNLSSSSVSDSSLYTSSDTTTPANAKKESYESNGDDNFAMKTGSYTTQVLNNSLSNVKGNSSLNTYGSLSTYTQGTSDKTYDDYSKSYYNASRATFVKGNNYDFTLGAKESIAVGPLYNIWVPAKMEVGAGSKSEAWAGLKSEGGLGAKFETRAGFKMEAWTGVKMEPWSGVRCEMGAGLRNEVNTGIKMETLSIKIANVAAEIKTKSFENKTTITEIQNAIVKKEVNTVLSNADVVADYDNVVRKVTSSIMTTATNIECFTGVKIIT